MYTICMVQIFTDFLTHDERVDFKQQIEKLDTMFCCPHTGKLVPCDRVLRQHVLAAEHVPDVFHKCIQASPVEYNYIEWWYNTSDTEIDRHVDNDFGHEMITGEIHLPLRTYVYYMHVDVSNGGELILFDGDTDDIVHTVNPVENSLVVFDSRFEHTVAAFDGERVSYAINPWLTRPVCFFDR